MYGNVKKEHNMERKSKAGGFTLPGMNLQGFGNAKDGRSKSSAFQWAPDIVQPLGQKFNPAKEWGGTSSNPNIEGGGASFSGFAPIPTHGARHLVGRHKKFGIGSKWDPLGRGLGIGNMFGGLFGATRGRRKAINQRAANRAAAIDKRAARRKRAITSKRESARIEKEMNV